MRLPPESVLQYIENNRGIEISRHGFASQEYYNPNHPQGKHTPAFYANSGKGDGNPVKLVEIDKVIYVVDRTGRAVPDPIMILKSGRT